MPSLAVRWQIIVVLATLGNAPIFPIMKNPPLGLMSVRAIAIAVTDEQRANEFYGKILGLPPAVEDGVNFGFLLDETLLLLKPVADWYGRPSDELNARITLEVENARETEQALRSAGVTISDPIADYDGHPVGAFLDSEGNKIWFCSKQE
jgi:catechol 2,3-dioxygenase-like lactoylglutathione lyase family enzyme